MKLSEFKEKFDWKVGLSLEDFKQKIVPNIPHGFEPFNEWFTEDFPGAWKEPFIGLTTRAAWVNNEDRAMIIYYLGSITVREFSTIEELHNEVKTMKEVANRH